VKTYYSQMRLELGSWADADPLPVMQELKLVVGSPSK